MKNKRINNIILYILIVILIEPTIMIKVKIINYAFIIASCVIFVALIYKYEKVKISKLLLLIIFYRLFILGMTFVNNGDILKWGYTTLCIICLYIIIDSQMKIDSKNVIKALNNVFTTYLLINIVTYILFPTGIYKGLYFLGIRTRFTDFAYPAIMISIIDRKINKNKIWNLVFRLIIIGLNIVIPKISTAYIGIAFFVIGVIIHKIIMKFKNKDKSTYISCYKILLIIILLINLLVVVFRVQNKFAKYIEDIFDKTTSLSGRTYLWDASYKHIEENFVLGHGYPENGNFILYKGLLWQGHNQFLQIMYEGGLIALISFILILLKSNRKNVVDKRNNTHHILEYGVLGFVLMMITEIYAYYIPFYILIDLLYNSIYIGDEEKIENIDC